MGTGKENHRGREPPMAYGPAFRFVRKTICNAERGFALTPDFSDTYDIEYYNADGINYASISVVKL